MPRARARRSRALIWVVAALACLLLPFVTLAATVAVTGFVTVEIEDAAGGEIFLPMPALVADLGLALAPRLLPAEARRELAPFRQALRSIADDIDDCPDATLLEVIDRGERVTFAKEGRSLVLRVEGDEQVTVAMPSRLVSSMVRGLV
ncbi:MAG: hypothetical protein AAGN46_03520 [Acidobacteriota bacterium]